MKTRPIILLVAFLLASCTTLQQGADPVVVNAERVTYLADDTFNVFLKLEHENRGYVTAHVPEAHKFANYLRQPEHARKWLKDARDLTKAYKQNRSPENKAQLQTALAVFSSAMSKAKDYTTQIATKGP